MSPLSVCRCGNPLKVLKQTLTVNFFQKCCSSEDLEVKLRNEATKMDALFLSSLTLHWTTTNVGNFSPLQEVHGALLIIYGHTVATM